MSKKPKTGVAKAVVVGENTAPRQPSNAVPDISEKQFLAAGALEPPYNPAKLVELYEESSALRPNVEAYVQNIEGNGFRLEPVIDLDGDDAREIVADSMRLERLDAIDRGEVIDSVFPTDDEIDTRMRIVQNDMELERFRIQAFFSGCVVEEPSFISLRRKSRADLEVSGNGYWETLRDANKKIVQFTYLPMHTMRLLAQNPDLVDVELVIRQTPITVKRITVKRRFRSFVQVTEIGRVVYFKELGDPRTMSASSGTFYANDLELASKEPKAVPATEVLHFRIHSPRSAYGIPRWIGATPSVVGTREAEEVNLLYFQNKSVPPLAVIVSGGRLTSEATEKIKDFVNNEIKGKGNFHKILIIEAEASSDAMGENNGRMKIELRPLTQAQQQDALFQKYDERNHDKIGFSFRLPRLLRGDVRDFNRSTAEAALELAETQVFSPERVEFDALMNRHVLAPQGVRYWTFASNASTSSDPKAVATMVAELTKAGVLVPADGRKIVGELVFRRRLARIDADWVYQPIMLTQVGVPLDTVADGEIPKPTPPAGGAAPVTMRAVKTTYGGGRASRVALAADARNLIALRDELVAQELVEAKQGRAEATTSDELVTETMRLPASVITSKFGVVPT